MENCGQIVQKILLKLQPEKRQPTQQKAAPAKIDVELKQLLFDLLASLDKGGIDFQEGKQLMLLCLKHLFKHHAATVQKSTIDVCADTAVLIMAKLCQMQKPLALHLVSLFVSFIRILERRPSTKPEPIFFAFYHCLKLSPQLVSVAKEKELIGKLFALITPMYDVSAAQPRCDGEQLNLNYLICLSNLKQDPHLQPILGGTLESMKSSVRGGISSRNACISPTKVDERKTKLVNRPLFNNLRPSSEPPNILKAEEFKEPPRNPVTQVPPIHIDQIPVHQTPQMQGFQSTSTSVMMNFFNMPHGERVHQEDGSGVRQNSASNKNSMYKYTNQSSVAQTRLTRRQNSVLQRITKSRGNKTSQSPIDNQNPYSDESLVRQPSIVPQLNLNQVKIVNTMPKSVERQASGLHNITGLSNNQPQGFQNSQSGNEDELSAQLDQQILGTGQSAEQKLKQLATQLGESCLTQDIAALMSQKREIDLAMTARKLVHKPDYIKQMQDVAFKKPTMVRAQSEKALPFLQKGQSCASQQKPQVVNMEVNRLILLNMVSIVLADVSIEEARFVRKPTILFTCFMGSETARQQRRALQVIQLVNGCRSKYEYVFWSLPNKNQESQEQNQKWEQDIKSLPTTSNLIQLLSTVPLFQKCKLIAETKVVHQILQKFSFVNDDIMKTQTTNELNSFTARESNYKSPNSVTAQQDCIRQIQNPNSLWSHNGIGYDISQRKDKSSTFIAQTHIKRKLDSVLYQVSRRIIAVFNSGFEITSFDFADGLFSELSALTTYLEKHTGRLILQQFIDVCLEPVFLVKKALVEVTLEMRILAMDFTKPNWNGQQKDQLDELLDSDNRPNDKSQEDLRAELIRCQRRLRDLYSEFLLLLSMVIKRTQTEQTLKLLNEVFIFDEIWNESVKAFTISLYLADLAAPLFSHQLTQQQLEVCESLRGINIINFDEKTFMDTMLLLAAPELVTAAKEGIYSSFIQAASVLKYLKSITQFFNQVSQLYFPMSFEPRAKKQQEQPGQEQDPQKVSQKYWKHVIRRVLYQLMYLIVHPNGLFYLYLQKNCLNYSAHTAKTKQPKSALNFRLTEQVLQFLGRIFDMPSQFTKYVFNEELLLFYIRTHYISFVKLYNKNYRTLGGRSDQGPFVPSIELCKSHIECLFAIAKHRTEDTRRKLFQFKICSFLLQEIGLEYEMQQRQETFLKFKQAETNKLKKTDENNTVQRPTKANSPAYHNQGPALQTQETFQLVSSPQPQGKKAPFIPALKVGGLGLSTLVKDNGKTQEEQDVEDLCQNKLAKPQSPVKKTAFVVPPLKVGGLGFSTLIKDNGKTQEEMDADNLVKAPQFQHQRKNSIVTDDSELEIIVHQSHRSKLNSQRNALNQDGSSDSDDSYYTELERLKAANPQPKPNPGKPLFKLTLGGLGLSSLVKEGGKTQEELDVDQIVAQGKMKPVVPLSIPKLAAPPPPPPPQVIEVSSPVMIAVSNAQPSVPTAPLTTDAAEQQKTVQVTEEMLYLNERTVRPIYQDEDLHVLMLSLMMCLLLKPQRGTLDELYCSQFPIDNENQNFLFLLHFHMSHKQNQDIVPKLLQKVELLSPQLAGQRLLKLLCPTLFDMSLYNNGNDWVKLAEGAYGVVSEVASSMAEPRAVAVKKMSLPQSIYDRCVLHDIFTEITCLEEFRLESCVTDLFDYGVSNDAYFIVMKRYQGSLTQWRQKQQGSMQENLSLYLSIYREILKCFKKIHSHNVTHYDIKGDNILIDFDQQNPDNFQITVGDFGESHMYTSEKDELQSRNKGTEHIKSPEMLQLNIAIRKDTDKYDRRKRVGTNSLSDVWALGCLFYELLTGEVLFQTEEYFEFHVRLTQHTTQLIDQNHLDKLNNNVYLIDFLKYVLVRDMHLRPTIDSVLKRFEHIHALLVATSSGDNRINNRLNDPLASHRGQKTQISTLLERAATIIENNGKAIEIDGFLSNSGSQESLPQVVSKERNLKYRSEVMRIMEDVFIASDVWLERRASRAVKLEITHVIIDRQHCSRQIKDMFTVLELQVQDSNAFKLLPSIMDFLRKAALFKGRVLFVEGREEWGDNQVHTLSEIMLLCLAAMYQTSAYETYTLIKSQNLCFKVETQRLIEISNFVQLCDQAHRHLQSYPIFSCVCGACVIILKRQCATYQNMHVASCRCCHYYKNVETAPCPSTGCNDLVTFIQTYYPHLQTSLIPEGKLNWGYVKADDFMFGPNSTGITAKQIQRQVALNLSLTIDQNSVLEAVTEKINTAEMTSQSSIRKQYRKSSYNQVQQAPSVRDLALWRLMKCRQCSVWTYAYNEQEQKYAILLNNRQTESSKEHRLLLSRQSAAGGLQVRVPILKKIKLISPF